MFSIYSKQKPNIPLDGKTLFENHTYLIVLDNPENREIEILFNRSGLKKHISWHPGNKVAELCITNYIGFIRIFDQEYDIRSVKFDASLSGREQLALIVSELDQISEKISFSYDSSIYSRSVNDWDTVENNHLHTFNYIYQLFFDIETADQAGNQLEKIKRNPSLKYETILANKPVWTIKHFSPSALKQLTRTGFTPENRNFNSNIQVDENVLSTNTSENQFVKYFYTHCQQICLKVLSSNTLPDVIQFKANKLLADIQRILADPFFAEIKNATRINTNSTILSSRDGYSTLMSYFINSLFSVKHIFEDFESELKVDLVDIATLYEIWCFYKLASQVLGENIVITEKTSHIKNDKIKYSTTFENQTHKVSYNRTFSIASGGSYSTTLRPDITVQDKFEQIFYHFDAKYRVDFSIGSDNRENKSFKNDDIVKMHSYLDAIYCSKSAMVLYPGTKFQFFERSSPSNVVTDMNSDFELNGVGALPLIPGNNNLQLAQLAEKFIPS